MTPTRRRRLSALAIILAVTGMLLIVAALYTAAWVNSVEVPFLLAAALGVYGIVATRRPTPATVGPRRPRADRVHAAPVVLTDGASYQNSGRARTDEEPSAFDRLVGLHGYQRPAYEQPGTPPPPPETPIVHEGATEQWSPVRELEAADAGTNLQGLTVGSKEWWDAAGPCPDVQWWDEWEQQYRAELALIGRCHKAAIDEAFSELEVHMCATDAERCAFDAAYRAKAAALAAIDDHAAELVAS